MVPRRIGKSVCCRHAPRNTPHLAHPLRQSTPIHEDGKLGHSLSKKGLCIWILEERIVSVPVSIVIVIRIRAVIEVGAMILVLWIICRGLVSLAGESCRRR